MTLGSGRYQSSLVDRSGATVLHLPSDELVSGTWARTLSDTSQATAITDRRDAGDLEPWAHTLVHYRDGRPCWRGPVFKVDTVGSRTTITARDLSARFARRMARVFMAYEGLDAALVAQLLMLAELGNDDPDLVVPNLMAANAGYVASITVDPNAPDTVAAALQQLAEAGLTWTVVGGRLLLGRLVHKRETSQLTDAHFVGELPVSKDGAATVTDATVTGKGCVGRWRTDAPATGALEVLEKRDALTTIEQCVAAARSLVEAGAATPRVVSLPSGAVLRPEAPVSVEQLIPGVTIPIGTRVGGRPIYDELELHGVSVSFGAGGEQVSITAGKAVAPTPSTPQAADSAMAAGVKVGTAEEPKGFEFTTTEGFPPWWIEGPGIEKSLPTWWHEGWAFPILEDAVKGIQASIEKQSQAAAQPAQTTGVGAPAAAPRVPAEVGQYLPPAVKAAIHGGILAEDGSIVPPGFYG